MSVIRRQDGSLRKEDPKITEEMESDVIKFRTAIARATILSTLQGHPGWETVKEILNEKIKVLDRTLDNFKQNEHRYNDLIMQERKDFKFLSGIVDDFTGSVPGFERTLADIEKALDERRKATAG